MTPTASLSSNLLKQILKFGQSIWYDGLVSKEEFRKLIEEDGIRGATTNPTIFEKAIAGGEVGSTLHGDSKKLSTEEIYKTIAIKAVGEVIEAFDDVYKETSGDDGFVSLEVSPLLAYNTKETVEEARELWRRVAKPNVMIKVPATREGIPAIETLISEGINVNVTLIFSIARYREVMEAYLRGLEKRCTKSEPIAQIASVASFFVSRVDTEVDKLLEAKGLKALLGKAAIANSKAAYEAFGKVFSSERFKILRKKGARVQRPLWASTGTKNPRYSDVLYVEALMGPETVNTVPPATLTAFRDHGCPASRLAEGFAEARAVLENLKKAGIDLDEVTQKLEEAGVKSFADSYQKIIQAIQAKVNP